VIDRSTRGARLAGAGAALSALLLALPPAPTSAAARPQRAYTTSPARYVANPQFVVTYRGSGNWRTTYRSTPPNRGGKADRNAARDSSSQAWQLRFRRRVAIPPCQPLGSSDSCRGLADLIGATGPTAAAGRIRHVHVDGLYRSLNATSNCRLRRSTRRGGGVYASIGLRYAPESQTLNVTAHNPVTTVLALLPGTCPNRVDSIDGLLDNYFTPGFSFAAAYGPDRWFTSRGVAIPVAVFHRSATITIRLARTRAGTPPRHCAVKNRMIERCTTGGSWRGVLTFQRR
jgi:hypothetical protein